MNGYTPRPYLEYKLGYDGYLFPQFAVIFDLQPFNRWHEKDVRYNSYLEFLKSLKISENPSLSEISQAVTYRKHLFDQVKHYIKELENIDQSMFSVLEKMLYKADDKDKARADFYHFCNGLRRCIPFENLKESWVPKNIEKHVSIDDDFLPFIEHSTKRKQKILNVISPLFEKFMHLESFLFFYETGEPVSEGFPDASDLKLNKIIEWAINGGKVQRKNKEHAKKFMNSYADVKKENPGLNISDYIRKIGMTETSDVTYREWIEKFNKAEQMLSNDD